MSHKSLISAELGEKINFKHIPSQKQILTKLSSQVIDFASKLGYAINQECSKKCQDLLILLELMGNDDHRIGKISSSLLLSLINKKYLCPTVFASSTIALSALQRPVQNFVFELLMLLTEHSNISQLSAPTTLSRIFSSQNKNPSILFSEVQKFLVANALKADYLRKAVLMLLPFFVYVLSKPQYNSLLVTNLLETELILQQVRKDKETHLLPFLVQSLCDNVSLQADSFTNLTLVIKISIWCLENELDDGEKLKEQVICVISSLVWSCYKKNESVNIEQAMILLKSLLIKTQINILWCQSILLMCSMMLMETFDENLKITILETILILLPRMILCLPIKICQLSSSMLILPLLQLFSDKIDVGLNVSKSRALAKNIFNNIQNLLSVSPEDEENGESICLNGWATEISILTKSSMQTIQLIVSDEACCINWLDDVMKCEKKIEKNIILMLSVILLNHYACEEVFDKCLECIQHVCKSQPILVTQFLPLLMFLLNRKEFQGVKIKILYLVPKLAVGKMLISPVLKFLTLLSTNDELLPIAIQLMTSLWKNQQRVFPYLLQMLNKEIDRANTTSSVWYDLMVAKATCVLKICESRSTQYGQDMVVILSSLMESLIDIDVPPLQIPKKESVSSALAMVIEALSLLCIAEVIDIESIWKAIVLKVQKKKDLRINRSLCGLSAAASYLPYNKRKNFIEEVLEYLWYLVQNEDAATCSYAFEAISSFQPSFNKVKFLPSKLSASTCLLLKSSKEFKDEETFEPLEEPLPGYVYIQLLDELDPVAIPGFKKLLTKALQTEINALPRGVGRRNMMKPSQSMTSSLPDVLRHLYESSTRPGMLPGVAAGLLSCYEPYVRNMDVKNPAKKHIKAVMERYKQILSNLLNDYTINTNEWAHVMSTPKLWAAFMTQMYSAFIEGRVADLEIQLENGEIKDKSIFEEEIMLAKYWSRDQITNQLRTASKGTPKVQGNSIFALVALANAVVTSENENIRKEECCQYVSMRHWLLKVVDTVHVVFDGNAKLPGKPFQWCQQVSSDRSTASSFLSRCAAAVSLSELVRPLLPLDASRIFEIAKALRDRCPGQPKAGTSSVLHFYTCIGYGLLLSHLQHSQSTGVMMSANEEFNMVEYMKALKSLVCDEQADGKEPAIIGYTLALSSAVLNKSKKDCRYVLIFYDELQRKISAYDRDELTTLEAQCFCFSLASLTTALYNAKWIDLTKLIEIHSIFYQSVEKTPQASDLYLSLGCINNLILRSNSTKDVKKINAMLKHWEDSFSQTGLPILTRLGIVKSILSTCGCMNLLYDGEQQKATETPEMKSAVKKIIKTLENSDDVLVSLISARLLGELYLSNSNTTLSNQLPQSFSYLGEKSLLSSSFDILQSGIEKQERVQVVLDSLSSIECPKLPPVNWALVLRPFFHAEYNESVRLQSIKFSMKFSLSCVDLALWLSSFLQISSFINLSQTIQNYIFTHALTVLNALSNSKQRILLEELPLVAVNNAEDKESMIRCILQSWLAVVDLPVPIQSTFTYIFDGIQKLISNSEVFNQVLSDEICDIFTQLLYKLTPEHWRNIIEKLPDDLQIIINIKMLTYVDSVDTADMKNLLDSLAKLDDDSYLRSFLEGTSRFHDNKNKMAILKYFYGQLKEDLLSKESSLTKHQISCDFIGYLCNANDDSAWFIQPIRCFQSDAWFNRLCDVFAEMI